MMERGRFDDLVDSIEQRFEDRPEALASHTWRWLLLGYAVVISLTVLLIGGGLAVFVAGTLTPGIGVLLIVIGGALLTFGLGQVGPLIFVDHYSPTGRTLADDEAPELRQLVTLLQKDLVVPPLSEIVLTDDFNAAIMQHPRLGIFGWPKSWLILGVPLLLATSPQELASVLAHECGHLSKKHGRQGNRIYQMHESWERLFQKLQQQRGSGLVRFASSLLARFLNWYWPRFHARAFVLSRQNEYLADSLAVDATSVDYAASALWRIDCTGYMLENEFWRSLWKETESTPEPPTNLCQRLRQAYRDAPQSADAGRWCDYSLQKVTSHEDSHPSLSDRLRAIGVAPEDMRASGFPAAPKLSAADALLGAAAGQIQDDISDLWRKSVLSIWRDRHRRISSIHRLATESQQSSAPATDDPVELWNQMRKVADLQGLDATEPYLRKLLSLQSDHVGATFALGQLRLNQGHDDGEDLLQHVVSLQTAEWTQPAGQVLERHLSTIGQRDALRQLRQQLDQFEKDRADAETERTNVQRTDAFVPHDLSSQDLKKVQAALLKQEHCLVAWLVQKQVHLFPEEKLFVLCVDSNVRAGGMRSDRNDRMITSLMLSVELPGRLFVATPTGEFRAVANRIMKEAEWQIFDRSQVSPESLTAE